MKTLFTVLFASLTISLFAQQTEGTIEFKEITKLKIQLPEGVKMDVAIPDTRTKNKLLHFTTNESVYLNGEKEEKKDTNVSSGGVNIVMKYDEPDNRFYKNIGDNTKVEKQEFFGKTFLIEDKLDAFSWKLTGKQKKILDYVCQEATYLSEEDTVSAWFTPQIPVSNGPAAYGQLPGMILEISKNSEQFVVTATKVITDAPEGKISVPSKGKKVTQDKFDAVKKEKMEEMKKMYGGGSGNTFIIKSGK